MHPNGLCLWQQFGRPHLCGGLVLVLVRVLVRVLVLVLVLVPVLVLRVVDCVATAHMAHITYACVKKKI